MSDFSTSDEDFLLPLRAIECSTTPLNNVTQISMELCCEANLVLEGNEVTLFKHIH